MKKRFLSFLLVTAMLISLIVIPNVAMAANYKGMNVAMSADKSKYVITFELDSSDTYYIAVVSHKAITTMYEGEEPTEEDAGAEVNAQAWLTDDEAAHPISSTGLSGNADDGYALLPLYKAKGSTTGNEKITLEFAKSTVDNSLYDGKFYVAYTTAIGSSAAQQLYSYEVDASGNVKTPPKLPMTAPTVTIAEADATEGGVKATINQTAEKDMVDHYVVNLYAEGADPKTATPIATSVNITPNATGDTVWTLPINPQTRPNYKNGSKVIAMVTAVAKDSATKGDATSAAPSAAADPAKRKFVKPTISSVTAATTSATLTTTSPVAPGSAGYYDIKYTLDGGTSTTLAGNKTITGLTAGNNYSVKIQFAPNTQGNAYYIASDESEPKTFTTDNYAFTVDAASKAMAAVEYGTAPTAVTFTITNTGNKQLTFDTANKANTNGFSASIAPTTVAAGGTATLTVSANAGLNAGTYAPVFTINGKNGSNTATPADVTVNLTVNKKEVTITPKTGLAKFYGQEKNLTLADCDIIGATAAQLNGVTVTSTGSGENVDASDTAYPITISAPAASNPNYDIKTPSTANGLKVNKATLDAAITAGNIRDGQKVGDSKLSGSFTNHYNSSKKVQTTEGTLEWDDKDTVLHADATKGWTFTPTSTNYEPVTGTAKITVSALTQPTINANPKTVAYNGSAQAIDTPTANSGGAVTVTYEKDGTAVTNPTNAGTYTAIVNVAANGAYAAGTTRTTLTITPLAITLNDTNLTISNKIYDKTTTAAIAAGSVLAIANKVGSDDVAIDLAAAATSVTFADADAGDGKNVTVTITPSADALTGAAKGNYELKAATITKQANITARPITIDIRDITKQYGVEHTFNGQGWQIAETQPANGGLVGNDSRDSLGFKLASVGAAADKDAGKYAVTWTKTNNNYTVTVNPADLSQKFTVTQVTPIEATAVTAGGVKQNATLSTSKLNGTFKHPATNAPVPGTLTWDDGTKTMGTIGDATEAWTFTPDNTTNYAIVKGTATVTVADKAGAGLTVQSKTVTYDGTAKAIDAPTADSDGRITITYTDEDGTVVAEPINAGTYTVEVVIDATEEYQGETANVELIIEPAVPAGSATASAIEKGDKLNQSVLTPNFTDKDGNKIDGDIEWTPVIGQTPDIIEPDGKTEYTYTFTSNDGNYKIVAKTLVPINSTEREPVVTKIINIPNTEKPDYLYLSLANLKTGDVVVFHSNSALTGTPLGKAEITDEIKAAGESVKVNLTGLNAKGGTIYAAFEDLTGKTSYKYDAEPDFTFNPTSVSVKKDSSKAVSIRSTGTVSSVNWTVASSSVATLSNESNTGATVKGAAKGSTTVTAEVKFKHPDEAVEETISITKKLSVTVTTSTGGGGGTGSSSNTGTSVIVSRTVEHISYLNGYPDGSFMPDNAITRAEAAAIFARIDGIDLNKSYAMNFNDTDANAWYAPYVGYMQQTGILQGYPEGNFNPGEAITRAEFATLVAKYKNLRNKQGANFTDVAAEYWAAGYIAAVQESGWVVGYNDGTFRPTNNITRAEVVQIVNNMLDRQIDVESLRNAEYKVFSDVTSGHWAYYQIIEASNKHNCAKENGKEIWKK